MSAVRTRPRFKKRVVIADSGNFELPAALDHILHYRTLSVHSSHRVCWVTDENGFHISCVGSTPIEGWESSPAVTGHVNFGPYLIDKIADWLRSIPDGEVAGYASTSLIGGDSEGTERGWHLIVDDKCLGVCRIIPAFG